MITEPIHLGQLLLLLFGLVGPAGTIGLVFVAWGRRTEQAAAVTRQLDSHAKRLAVLEASVADLRQYRAEREAIRRHRAEERSQYTPRPVELPMGPAVTR